MLTKLATFWMEKTEPGELVPIPTSPFWSMMKAVEVAVAVEVERVKSGLVLLDRPATESLAHGEVVPIPKPVDVQRVISVPPTMALMFPWSPAAKPVVLSARFGMITGDVIELAVTLLICTPAVLLAIKAVPLNLNRSRPLVTMPMMPACPVFGW